MPCAIQEADGLGLWLVSSKITFGLLRQRLRRLRRSYGGPVRRTSSLGKVDLARAIVARAKASKPTFKEVPSCYSIVTANRHAIKWLAELAARVHNFMKQLTRIEVPKPRRELNAAHPSI